MGLFLEPVSVAPATGSAVAVEHDLVSFDCESLWSEPEHAAYAAEEVEKTPALIAEEEMMMLTRRRFIVRRCAGNFHQPDLSVVNELF